MLVSQKNELHVLEEGHVTSPAGYISGGTHCGLRRKKLDFGWLYSETPAAAAAVYTQNSFQAAPLKVTKQAVAVEKKLQAVLINSANANACTGKKGMENAELMQQWGAEMLQLPSHYVAVQSTGLIGVQLPMEKIQAGIAQVDLSANEAEAFEQAILTTDTVTKHTAVEMEIEGKPIFIGGAAKGSGMIHPNMATMLAYMTTDAAVDADALQRLLSRSTDRTYNMITVDGDSSTNDTVIALANAAKETSVLDESHPEWDKFEAGFQLASEILAKKIARDGEGATKLLEVHVQEAATSEAARAMAKAVISSNLVKTAVYGADPNWGRVVCALGYSGEEVDPDAVDLYLGPIKVVEDGLPTDFSEAEGTAYLEQDHVVVTAVVKAGQAEAAAWGCDLTYDYVKINASYRT
ncbi:bifunctional glutamate N-acetyltransferase/amino-acid acetyltransferase ArgJ [Alkalicoccus chagannorensis]|uniref:bifunctional glutamate N-acetyltransferase/amino-acid acetyltransferase ArgJ n=1 Tax=Alkalicoccus chagannorensis TaxID=427072 RepID=UPI00040F3E61|nr:bifunctional glutamate N-acetyltransferase/amino-acid acetyltransferase ArgJ [Alkalicoccus chagannorensis]